MKADTVESVYQSLPGGNAASSRPESVNEFLTEFIRPTSDAEKVIKASKPVHIDKMNVFVTEEAKKEKRILKTKKRDPKLTAREKRRLKIYDIPKEAHKYELFIPLSALWQEYMEKLLKQGTQNFEQKLIKADFHGAPFTVIQSTNPSYVGVTGIIVQETLSMFKIITKEDKMKQIPKNSTIFTIKIKKNEKQEEKDYVLYGQQFVSRPSERAVKKFKPKPSINM